MNNETAPTSNAGAYLFPPDAYVVRPSGFATTAFPAMPAATADAALKKVAAEKSCTRYLRSMRMRSTSVMAQLSNDENNSEYATPLRTRLTSKTARLDHRMATHAIP